MAPLKLSSFFQSNDDDNQASSGLDWLRQTQSYHTVHMAGRLQVFIHVTLDGLLCSGEKPFGLYSIAFL